MKRPSETRPIVREVEGGRDFGPLVIRLTDSALVIHQKYSHHDYTVAWSLIMWTAARAAADIRKSQR